MDASSEEKNVEGRIFLRNNCGHLIDSFSSFFFKVSCDEIPPTRGGCIAKPEINFGLFQRASSCNSFDFLRNQK